MFFLKDNFFVPSWKTSSTGRSRFRIKIVECQASEARKDAENSFHPFLQLEMVPMQNLHT